LKFELKWVRFASISTARKGFSIEMNRQTMDAFTKGLDCFFAGRVVPVV
jgi:hypothetical protein